jgi:hypothetical protein
MHDNPYNPPAKVNESKPDRFWLFYVAAYWISFLAAVLQGLMAVGIVISNLPILWTPGNLLPTYIYCLFFLIPSCAIAFGYSAIQWKRRLPRRALVAFILATIGTFVGPQLLIAILY